MIYHAGRADSRDRMLVAATWLIALGSLFLIKDAAGWDWPQAWPLIVILVGVGTLASAIFDRPRSAFGLWAIWWPIAVIAVGIVLLLSTTGQIGLSPADLVSWWPLALIALGLWFIVGAVVIRPEARAESLTLPLEGAAQAEVRINFGGGELVTGPAPAGALLSGQFDGGVRYKTPGPGRVELEPYTRDWPFAWGRPLRWQVGLTTEVPVDLRLDSGANRSNVDLGALRLRRLELHTGASETRIRLPSAGASSVRAETGLASLTIEVPPAVAARIRSKMAIGLTSVDEQRFPRSFDGWASPDFETAANRVDVEVQGGLGSVRIV